MAPYLKIDRLWQIRIPPDGRRRAAVMTILQPFAILLLCASVGMAQSPQETAPADVRLHDDLTAARVDSVFGVSGLQIQVLGGVSNSVAIGSLASAGFDYTPLNLRIGHTLIADHESRILGNGDVTSLLDVMIAPVHTYGSIVTGPSWLLRKNLRPSNHAVIPYVQAGVGIVYTDADNNQRQGNIGRSYEFLLQTGLGLRWRLGETWSLDVEGAFQHISNAGLAHRNAGANNLGLSLGLTHFFGGSR
jgi:hypothetical protein